MSQARTPSINRPGGLRFCSRVVDCASKFNIWSEQILDRDAKLNALRRRKIAGTTEYEDSIIGIRMRAQQRIGARRRLELGIGLGTTRGRGTCPNKVE
jgi:hypothetical protein